MDAINDHEAIKLLRHMQDQMTWITEAMLWGERSTVMQHADRLEFWARELREHVAQKEVSRAA